MQRRRAQGLCFSCNKKFTVRHKCSKAQLLILKSEDDVDKNPYEESSEAALRRKEQEESVDRKIILYALTG